MSELHAVTHSAEETRAVGRAVAAVLAAGDLVLLAGELGAGKTELTKGIAEGLGVTAVVVSPTFTISRRYEGRVPLVHVDVYRLDRVQELMDLALEEELDDAITVVEWGDVARAYLPLERLEIRLERLDADDERSMTMVGEGPSWQARLPELGRALREAA